MTMFEPRRWQYAVDHIYAVDYYVGVYQIVDNPSVTFPGWYGLAHLKTGLAFPMVFEKAIDAKAAANKLNQVCNWDSYVEGVLTDPHWAALEDHLNGQMFIIADFHRGALLPGKPLDHQKIALMKRLATNNDAEDDGA